MDLRVVIWETQNCAFKDDLEKCNDLYVRAGVASGDF